MTPSRSGCEAQRSARDTADAPVENFQGSNAQASLSNLTLPVSTLLEFLGSPAVLWSEDRNECVFNRAATELVGFIDRDMQTGADLWLDCVDALDRERFLSAWQTLVGSDAAMVCNYRFIPRGATSTIELEETAVRLAVACSGRAAVLSRYRVREPSDGLSMRGLIHQIGNNLQSVRGEVDLLRLLGVLPQRSCETIAQGIDNIRELIARLDDSNRAKAAGTDRPAWNAHEVGNGRT